MPTISIVLLGRAHPGATDYWDGNWVRSILKVRAGGFTADTGELRADEIHRFAQGLKFINPDPVKHPLDVGDVRLVRPDQLLPPGYKLVAPDVGLPDPDASYQPQPPWTPNEPVDIRDIVQVPPGQLAPWGYVEYFPGWWAPGSQLTNTPTIPKPR